MRLLRRDDEGKFILDEFFGDNVPPYAILSHTWGPAHEEVNFKELAKRKGPYEEKPGYIKLTFCAEQAARHGLRHIWCDTSNIDKSSSAELQEAINSMFFWYQASEKCYVYLSDVSHGKSSHGAPSDFRSPKQDWITQFRQSRWFTRGWTLQELIAPKSVEFFSLEGTRLGDKDELVEEIHKITGIPIPALQGRPLSLYSVKERMSWAAGRSTTRQEDLAYSLQGLFDVQMPLLYGEGRRKAFTRVYREIQNALDQESLSEMYEIQPQNPLHQATSTAADVSMSTTVESIPVCLDTTAETVSNLSEIDEDFQHAEASGSEMEIGGHSEGEIGMELEQIWNREFIENTGHSETYNSVAVLLVRWADELDQLQTGRELKELEAVFRERFHFTTRTVELNVRHKPQHQLDAHLSHFIADYDGPTNLLIVYYTGHGVWHDLYNRLELAASFSPRSQFDKLARVDWAIAHDRLARDDCDADVLVILDTCYSSNARRIVTADTRKFELLSACSIDETTAAPGENSFSRVLIDTLKQLSEEEGLLVGRFSTYRLNQQILLKKERLKTPSQLWSIRSNPNHIFLAPLRPREERMLQQLELSRTSRSYLKLGFSLGNTSLDQDQIRFMVRALAKAFNDKNPVKVHAIDWLDIKPIERNLHNKVALVMWAVVQWKRVLSRNRQRKQAEQRSGGESSTIRIASDADVDERVQASVKRPRLE